MSNHRDHHQDPDDGSPPDHRHHHHGRGGSRTLADFTHDFFQNWSQFDGPFTEKVRLTLRNRAKAYLVPPIKGCCGHLGEPGC